jgi:hypothetical protein
MGKNAGNGAMMDIKKGNPPSFHRDKEVSYL